MIRIRVITLRQLIAWIIAAIVLVFLLVLMIKWIISDNQTNIPVLPSQAQSDIVLEEKTLLGEASASLGGQALEPDRMQAEYEENTDGVLEQPFQGGWAGRLMMGLIHFVFGVDLNNPASIMNAAIPGSNSVDNSAVALGESEQISWDEQHEQVPDTIKIEIEKLDQEIEQQQPDAPPVTAGNKQIFIYHTHSRESYKKQSSQQYQETSKWRTADRNYNVMRVADELKNVLEEQYGISVDHDTTDHEAHGYNTSYNRSFVTLKGYADKNPGTDLYIDLHRDAYIEGARGQEKNVDIGDGRTSAQLMFVIGTGGEDNPIAHWRENYRIATYLTNELNEMVPGLCRPVRVVSGRYNQQVAKGCILIEVGHNENTLAEALTAMDYLGAAIDKLINQ